MKLQKLSQQESLRQLQALPHWKIDLESVSIAREFVFPNFLQAFNFMKEIADLSENHNHHPDWRNVYNKVSIVWSTHDVQGLSALDFLMASLCDAAFHQSQSQGHD